MAAPARRPLTVFPTRGCAHTRQGRAEAQSRGWTHASGRYNPRDLHPLPSFKKPGLCPQMLLCPHLLVFHVSGWGTADSALAPGPPNAAVGPPQCRRRPLSMLRGPRCFGESLGPCVLPVGTCRRSAAAPRPRSAPCGSLRSLMGGFLPPSAAPGAAGGRGAWGLWSSVPSQAWGHVVSVLSE